ncbi:MAG: precorrin-6A/cobalt-precorrin-6A reductase [Pseudomonadota bacterium]
MSKVGNTLVLAGAREAHGIINGLVARGRQVIASLPEPERFFDPLPVRTRVGTFDSQSDLQGWLGKEEVKTLIDASHPFDARISEMAHAAAARRKVRYLRVLRPPWAAARTDQWGFYPTVRCAVEAIGPTLTVFSNTGWASLPEYERFRGRRVFFRQTHHVDQPAPYSFVSFVPGKPPFTQQQEEALFLELGVDRLICRNTGGAASVSKLLAARKIGLRVLMVERPPVPAGTPVSGNVAEALAWEADE